MSVTAGNAVATVTWAAPADDGGFSITGCTVTSSPGAKHCTWTSGPLPCMVTGHTNGVSYTFTVTATNAVGTGPASSRSAPCPLPFTDIAGSSFAADILWLYDSGITSSCSATIVCPDDPVTRGQMAAFLDRALHLPVTATDYFTDDAGTTFEGNINRLAASGITTGCGPTTFCPTAGHAGPDGGLPPPGLPSGHPAHRLLHRRRRHHLRVATSTDSRPPASPRAAAPPRSVRGRGPRSPAVRWPPSSTAR